MQGWLNGFSGSVMNLPNCCAPEYQIASVDETILLGKTPAKSSGEQNATVYSSLSSPRQHLQDYESRRKSKYSGFLLRAAERGDASLLLASLKSDGHLIEGMDPEGNTALHLAARKGHAQICEMLCQVVCPFVIQANTEPDI